jgi:hypothetical protein
VPMPLTRRMTAWMVGVLIVVLVVVAVAAQQRCEPRQTDAALQRAGGSINTQVERFHRQHGQYPRDLRLRSDAVELVGTSTTETYTIDLDPGVHLAWYKNAPDPRLRILPESPRGYSYCLDFKRRHWRLNADDEAVVFGGHPAGACPAAPAP